jgi:hypothetical protein
VTAKVPDVKNAVTATKSEFVSSARATTPDSAVDAGQRVTAYAQQNARVLSVLAAFGLGLVIGRHTAP